ncbi:hypothetical protein AKJ09_08577 [Labilithrix luteola]|uniref:Uncharacterized protein n=1 Tax=Labilithrix luteola TaxID=1391654 RepID=A0A0K1Q859_9BACT|nr:hypothetical protein AKJ09_08577 [Labilithrix luteola]
MSLDEHKLTPRGGARYGRFARQAASKIARFFVKDAAPSA